ncbi:MAG: MarR family transcriptional regulator [FCB group bacterium]|nr:MarR family transcriptional regulator [FCB group bacterium]
MTANEPHRIAENLQLLAQILTESTEDSLITEVFSPSISKTQLYLLKTLYLTGPKSIRDLAGHFGISNPAVSQSVEKLVSLSLVARKTTVTDRRSVRVSILKKGVDLLEEYESRRLDIHNQVLVSFTLEEQHQFNSLLEKYIQLLVKQSPSLEIMCLQCNDMSVDDCLLREHNRYCYQSKALASP